MMRFYEYVLTAEETEALRHFVSFLVLFIGNYVLHEPRFLIGGFLLVFFDTVKRSIFVSSSASFTL